MKGSEVVNKIDEPVEVKSLPPTDDGLTRNSRLNNSALSSFKSYNLRNSNLTYKTSLPAIDETRSIQSLNKDPNISNLSKDPYQQNLSESEFKTDSAFSHNISNDHHLRKSNRSRGNNSVMSNRKNNQSRGANVKGDQENMVGRKGTKLRA